MMDGHGKINGLEINLIHSPPPIRLGEDGILFLLD